MAATPQPPREALPARVLPDTWLAALIQDIPLVDAESNGVVPPTVPYPDGDALTVGLDHGNDAFKVALRHASEPRLVLQRTVSAYAHAKEIRSGEGYRTWRVDGSEAFWIGHDALSTGSPLPVGSSTDRIADARQLRFLAAVLVEALHEAGYSPGSYRLALGFGVPVEELSTGGIIAETRTALRDLREHAFSVVMDDPRHGNAIWELRFRSIIPIPQSFGAFLAWSRTLNGASATNGIDALTVLDFGGGHLQQLDIALSPKLTATGGLLGEGTVALARQLQTSIQQRFKGLRLSLAEAQHALVHREVIWGGEAAPINQEVDAILDTQGHTTVSQTLAAWQDQRKFIICTGGGAILLADLLRGRAAAVGRQPRSYLVMPPRWASVINAAGLFVHAMLVAHREAQG